MHISQTFTLGNSYIHNDIVNKVQFAAFCGLHHFSGTYIYVCRNAYMHVYHWIYVCMLAMNYV